MTDSYFRLAEFVMVLWWSMLALAARSIYLMGSTAEQDDHHDDHDSSLT